MAELANASIVLPIDPGLNIGHKKIFSVCVLFELKNVGR
jgi:hypothetical protein